MKMWFRALLVAAALSVLLPFRAFAAPFVPGPSSITFAGARLSCWGSVPLLSLTLNINPADTGRPGLVYVGAHDPMQTQGAVLNQSGAWEPFTGAMLTPYIIRRDGLTLQVVQIPLPNAADWQGWSVYVGYGALTAEADAMVVKAVASVATVRAQFPDRTIPAVNEDHFRRSLIQEDMRKNNKYVFVRNITPDLIGMCNSSGGN